MAKLVFGLLLVAMALLAAGANAKVNCNTNGKSPTQGDANVAIQYIRLLDNTKCCQQKEGDDSCTSMYTYRSARVKVCGEHNKCTKCITAGDALNQVLADCVENHQGIVRVSGSNEADGLTFVLEGTFAVGKNTTAKVIEMFGDE